MKTRSNMPLYVVECTDITKLKDEQIDLLRCGDYLVKKTGEQRHSYKVTYKQDGVGMCLTYHDASCVETVSYDYTDGHWVYNSTDKADLPINVEDASFKPLYFHPIFDTYGSVRLSFIILNNDPTPFTNMKQIVDYFKNMLSVDLPVIRIPCTGGMKVGSSLIVASQINITDSIFKLYGLGLDGEYAEQDLASYYVEANSVQDGVNKIN